TEKGDPSDTFNAFESEVWLDHEIDQKNEAAQGDQAPHEPEPAGPEIQPHESNRARYEEKIRYVIPAYPATPFFGGQGTHHPEFGPCNAGRRECRDGEREVCIGSSVECPDERVHDRKDDRGGSYQRPQDRDMVRHGSGRLSVRHYKAIFSYKRRRR